MTKIYTFILIFINDYIMLFDNCKVF